MTFTIRNIFILSLLTLISGIPFLVYAQSAEDVRGKISDQQNEIVKIGREIKKYEGQLTDIGKKKRTLQGAVYELDVSRNKVNASINLAQQQINYANETIGNLVTDIKTKETLILKNQQALAETIRRMNERESDSLVEKILNSDNISAMWNDLETLQQFQLVVRKEVKTLSVQKNELENVHKKKESEQTVLLKHKIELSTQKRSLDINRRAKNSLLRKTKNRESSYQKLLDTKRKAKKEFEAQLKSLESKLKYILDPSSIPPAGKGIFRWPLTKVRITQYFGNTRFAKSGAYSGKGHNGMDMGTPIGTPVMAVLAGNVRATGNTDAIKGCYSYGKWILLEHVNGLSTLYAHLSVRNVSKGQAVGTGEVIGYSGNTGYSTGPHLHFTVYASDAVKIVRLGDIKKRTHCANARIPVAAWSGYLNPLDYLK